MQIINVEKHETRNRRFGYHVCSNGVEIGVQYLKSVVVSSFDNHGYDEDNNFHPLHLTPATRIIGLDPGRASLYVAAGGSSKQQEIFKCSNSRWREISGATHGRQKRRNWNKKNPVLIVQISSGPSPKVSTTAAYCEYLRHVLSLRDDVLGFYRDPKWRRLRFKTRITRQKAYETLARELTDGDKNCIIAYGSGGFSSTSKGHAPTPNKHLFVELKKRCKVRLVSEYRTSQVCSNCGSQLQETKFWGIKKCNNHFAEGKLNRPHCLTLWNRDINAARNIRHMFLERNSNGDKLPEVFKKKEECSKEKNTKVSKARELSHVPSQPQASGSSKSSVGLAEAAGEEIC